ncbi:MAG: spherulation-specific family 4 protein [Rubripirellula sp.]
MPFLRNVFVALTTFALTLPVVHSLSAATVDVLVPAYANPCCDGGPNMWSALIATASDPNRNFQLHVIFNPASGPGVTRDGNYVDATGAGPLKDLRSAGGITHGYVATGFGDRSVAAVKADIDAYLTGHYAGFVDGVFFDEMSNDLADVGYYQDLKDYIDSVQSGVRTFGNPGTTFVNNPSSQTTFTAADYMDSLDTIVSFEITSDEYTNNYTSFPYLEGLSSSKIAHIVHTHPDWNDSVVELASQRGAGFLFVTDDAMAGDDNPYDTLPTYWTDFVSGVSAFNSSAVPEPSTMAISGIASLLLLVRRRRLQVPGLA